MPTGASSFSALGSFAVQVFPGTLALSHAMLTLHAALPCKSALRLSAGGQRRAHRHTLVVARVEQRMAKV